MKPKPRVTIKNTDSGYVYQYKGEAFAFVWAWKPLSHEWRKNLCLFLGYSDLNAWKTAHIQGKI
jgi:hypothetical protein